MAGVAIIDLLGGMLAASEEPVTQRLMQFSASDLGPCSTLLRSDFRRSATAAALVNGSAAHALDFDDVQFNAHPSTVLVPALLAAGERIGCSGAQVLRAYVVGYEVWGELHRREPVPYHDKGWHPTAVLGVPAAAAAVASLCRLDQEAARTALSLAASFTGGVVANFGAMAKPLHAGRAAAAAITSVDMALAGVTAGEDGLAGLLTALSPQGQVDLSPSTALGQRYFSIDKPLVFKKYPVCFSAHRPIDALLDLAQLHDISADNVEQIVVEIRATQARVLRFDRPSTALEGKFSMQFAAACALLRRRVTLADLEDGVVASPAVQQLMARVRLVERSGSACGQPATCDRVVITLKDGTTIDSGEIAAVLPHFRLREKFLDCCQAGGRSDGERLLERLELLDALPDIRQLAATI